MKTFVIFVIGILAVAVFLIYRDSESFNLLLNTSTETVRNKIHNVAPSTVSFTGTIKRFERPAPDIAYDFQIFFNYPVVDIDNASGLDQRVYFYILVPSTDTIRKQLEAYINTNVEVTGPMMWGYAESKYISVTKVTPK